MKKGTGLSAWKDDKKNIYIAGDSRLTCGHMHETMKSKKVFKKDGYIVGLCGSLENIQIIEHITKFPKKSDYKKLSSIDILTFILPMKIKKAFKSQNINCEKNFFDEKDNLTDNLIIGFDGHLVEVEIFGGVIETTKQFVTGGSGMQYSAGYLQGLILDNKEPKTEREIRKVLIRSLEIAAQFCSSVGPPFYCEKLKGEKK